MPQFNSTHDSAAFQEQGGVGPTRLLSLRLSVATQARLLFTHPADGRTMLALERRATLQADGNSVVVTSQPFGGAVRIQDPGTLRERIGDYNFDTHISRRNRDMRLYIRPESWPKARDFVLDQFERGDGAFIEISPLRELVEEIESSVGLLCSPNQVIIERLGSEVEETPTPTANIHAQGAPTVRVYNVFQIRVVDSALAEALLTNYAAFSDEDLRAAAREDARRGGRGWAYAVLVLPLDVVLHAFLTSASTQRDGSRQLKGHWLDRSVQVVLENLTRSRSL